ncbi:MAG: c-type cytochrome, partial [Proteobacteria bacterium]|nr:c-type cytochrome [Pseudomonadota bacterium]
RPHEEKLLVMQNGVIPFDGGEAVLRNTRSLYLNSPFKSNDASVIHAGKSLYLTYCVHCHGKYHDGNGTVGQSFQPLPGDLQNTRVQTMSEGALFKEISYGIPQGRQPPLATTVDVTDRWRIIAYIKSLDLRE